MQTKTLKQSVTIAFTSQARVDEDIQFQGGAVRLGTQLENKWLESNRLREGGGRGWAGGGESREGHTECIRNVLAGWTVEVERTC